MKALILAMILVSQAQAQTFGHPGGGRPDYPGKETYKCEENFSLSERLEEEFVKKWNKPYKNFSSFKTLVASLNAQSLANQIKLKKGTNTECEENTATQQIKEETLIIAKKLNKLWKDNSLNTRCGVLFRDRIAIHSELKELIQGYDNL